MASEVETPNEVIFDNLAGYLGAAFVDLKEYTDQSPEEIFESTACPIDGNDLKHAQLLDTRMDMPSADVEQFKDNEGFVTSDVHIKICSVCGYIVGKISASLYQGY